jgi:hypothetical protein
MILAKDYSDPEDLAQYEHDFWKAMHAYQPATEHFRETPYETMAKVQAGSGELGTDMSRELEEAMIHAMWAEEWTRHRHRNANRDRKLTDRISQAYQARDKDEYIRNMQINEGMYQKALDSAGRKVERSIRAAHD